LIDQIKRDSRNPGRWRRALRGVLCLLRYHPAGIVQILRDGVGRVLPLPSRHPSP
jgi:hypothetical protein